MEYRHLDVSGRKTWFFARKHGEMLRICGHDVTTAPNGREALEAIASFRPQVVVLDLGMPELDGLGAWRKIRELPQGQDILLVALTGWGREEDRDRTREAGFDHHLVKPVEFENSGKSSPQTSGRTRP